MSDLFKFIILNARPAAGKSEVIHYLKSVPVAERRERFHVGDVVEFDDFLYVWEKFEEDDICSKYGKERVWTDKKYYFKDHFLWNLFIEKINLAVEKHLRDHPDFFKTSTALVEFSRGGGNGFGEAYGYLSDRILKDAGILYIDVSYEESVRKNQKRKRPGLADSVLFHSLPDDKMEFYYKTNDWGKLTASNPTHIPVRNFRVPYSVLKNEPDVTDDPVKLGKALDQTFGTLWKGMR
ncbi:MAG: hypothetical protein V1495_10080 [Pseudomonadota bacterium]